MDTSVDRIQGMIEGLALGDALGVPHEFKYNNNVPYTGIIEHQPRFISRFQGTRYLVVGQMSDDTEMTLTLARSLIRHKGYNVEDVILSYERWANSTFQLGKNTRALFHGVKTIKGYQQRYQKIMDQPSQSNGSLMRCSPLALLTGYDEIVADCQLTNPHLVNLDANFCYLTALRSLLQGDQPMDVFFSLLQMAQTDPIKLALQQVEQGILRDVTQEKGWVAHAFYCAMASLMNFDNYRDGINWVISCKGDTDTNAAISGALLGARFGYNSLMSDSITHDNLSKVILADTSLGALPRPPEFTLADIEMLSQQLYDTFVASTH